MLYKWLMLVIVIGAMALLGGTAGLAQNAPESTPEPNSPQDNACYEGGTLWRENGDGCPTEWYWKAGWYLARVETGEIPVEDVPDEFQSAMPPVPTATPSLIEICKNLPGGYIRCIRSDQTGTTTLAGVVTGYIFFFDTVDPCYRINNDGNTFISYFPPWWETAVFHQSLLNLTSEDVATLGLKAYFCQFGVR